MLTPLPLGLGLRYVRARQHQYFVSFISWVSLAGICLGVAALIAILSVMNGFEGELRMRLLSLSAHATLPAPADPAALRDLAARARGQPGVDRVEPFVEVQGLLSHGATLAGTVLRGIDARDQAEGGALAAGDGGGPRDGSRRRAAFASRSAARSRSSSRPGRATMSACCCCARARTAHSRPRSAPSRCRAASRSGSPTTTLTLAFASLEDVAALAGPAASAGVRVFYADPFDAPRRTPLLAAALGTATGTDWTVEHAAYFRAIRLEKTMMTVILLLIVAVAAFNVVASLVMVVSEKRNDIAILRTLGLSRGGVIATFIVQGT